MLCSFHHVKRIVGCCQSKMLRERFAAGISCLVQLVFQGIKRWSVPLGNDTTNTKKTEKKKKGPVLFFPSFFLFSAKGESSGSLLQSRVFHPQNREVSL